MSQFETSVCLLCTCLKANVSDELHPIHPAVRIGHVHLKVADLERVLGFYRDVLGFEGFEVTQRMGRQAAFLSAGIAD